MSKFLEIGNFSLILLFITNCLIEVSFFIKSSRGALLMRKTIGSALLIITLVGTFFSTSAHAKEYNDNTYAKNDLVGLGDSITFGYNLGINNDIPSNYAFPFLIGEYANLEVRDLGVPGWTTDDLLKAIKNDRNFRESVKQAGYITLDIGNNDLIHTLKATDDLKEFSEMIELMVPILKNNLDEIIREIRKLNDAPIVMYNFYNPFQVTNQPKHALSDQLLSTIINPNIAIVADKYNNVKIADAFSAFDEKQDTYVRKGDIHPTIAGQEVLANIGKKALGIK